MTNGRKRFQEFFEVWDDGCHLGLLKHDLGNPDDIRIVGFSPGEIPALLLVPAEEILLNPLFAGYGQHSYSL
jgi:hypothetical protein